MKIAKITYKKPLFTEILHYNSSSITLTDAPKDNNGEGKFLSPTDMVATSLGSCMMTIIGIYCLKNNIQINNLSCEVSKTMSSKPRKIESIAINMDLSTSLSESDKHLNKIEDLAKN